MSEDLWADTRLQAVRLVAEMVQTLDGIDVKALAESMDLEEDEVLSLFTRIENLWEEEKFRHCYKTLSTDNVSCEDLICKKVNLPVLFRDNSFVQWLNEHSGKGLATWHVSGGNPNEYSDVFILKDGNECSDSEIPKPCWELLCRVVEEQYCLIWITNLAE